jgi:hypothetical protein
VNLNQIASESGEWETPKHRHGESLENATFPDLGFKGGMGMSIAAGDAKVMLN